MKIKEAVLERVNNPLSRTRIALELGVGEQTVARQMSTNAANGRLTKMDALLAISKESGYQVSEILESEAAAVGQ